jgi:predicted RecB family nuclease
VARTLSKSRYQKGLQCEKALWLGVHRRDLAPSVSEVQQAVFDQGSEVGRLAQRLFPGGVEVTDDHLHQAEALESTRRLLAEGVRILYEPAFTFGGAFARVDILVGTDGGVWDLYEVKSSASLKDVHITDAAVQAYAVEGSGLPVRTINVVHLDSSYVYQGGAYDLPALFKIDNVTDMAREYMRAVPAEIARLQTVLDGPEPVVRVGMRCTTPYPCEFAGYCHAFLPAEHPVTDLPRLHEPELHALLDAGIRSILDIPPDFPGLTATQRETVEAVQAGEPRVDAEALAAALSAIVWPAYHLDFETIMPALPLWPGTRPYQTIPFQYSIHAHHRDGSVWHHEYLHAGTDDPRPRLARHLLTDLGAEGSIVHYSSYERTQIDGLASALPEIAHEFSNVRKRLFDLESVIRRTTRHPRAGGSSSIKRVLPAWCPDLTYKGMSIADGQTASVRYLRVVRGLASAEETEATLRDLSEYCALDTFAMVRLLEEMLKLAAV